MPSPDGWTEGDGDLPFLPKQDGFDGIRRFFDDLLGPNGYRDENGTTWKVPMFWHDGSDAWTTPQPPLRFLCTACDGDGRIASLDASERVWVTSCPACDGSGSMTIVPERKGTR